MRCVASIAVLLTFHFCASTAIADAVWHISADGGLRSLDGSDGCTAIASKGGGKCLTMKEGGQPPSLFLYFAADNLQNQQAPLYVVIEYFDAALAGQVTLEYDSSAGDTLKDKYRPADQVWGGWLTGSRKWKTAVFSLEQPRMAHRQNLGADFRLGGTRLFIRSVKVTSSLPQDVEKLDEFEPAAFKPRVKIGDGGQLIIGGFDPPRKADGSGVVHSLEAALPAMKSLGVTSHEGYVRWNLCEPEPGKYDWSVYDAFVEVYKKYDIKWVPFLIIGSAYSLPEWYYKKPGSQGYVCLEHGEQSDVQSLWNPALRDHVARFIQAFCEHYRDTGVIESILLGITGNYGEAIYVATGNDWTADIYGPYHTHPGFWAGDPFAIESFRGWLGARYADVSALNNAWKTSFGAFGDIKPFLRANAPNDRAWLDFAEWYIGSMNDWAYFWMETTRKNFPQGDVYLCTGGHAPVEHGADFGDQCKLAAKIGGGVRITNEGSYYPGNFSLTRWVASASRQYGAYFSFEPAGAVDASGVITRIYNATASGAKGLHYYYPNIFGSDAASRNFEKWGRFFTQREPSVEIAVYYPETHIRLNGNDFLDKIQPLRDRFDFDYMSDNQILDGGLDHIKALVLVWGNTSEQRVWNAIIEWVRKGGILLYPTGMGMLRTVEGDEQVHEQLFGLHADLGSGRVAVSESGGNSPQYRTFVTTVLTDARQLSRPARRMLKKDGEEDGVFVTVVDKGRILWLDTNSHRIALGRKPAKPRVDAK